MIENAAKVVAWATKDSTAESTSLMKDVTTSLNLREMAMIPLTVRPLDSVLISLVFYTREIGLAESCGVSCSVPTST